eukprot:CAMPEP_0117693042 /NCGR_PEP_ID=MMETSP0804-20121206/26656_1 /TAXON_ID=1074897 /ORGANISM="Tetraselmis astigmatica, Strain CCMP880" /LENGTH=183 /DNA_ID=CAMNT_0005506543 /DNA_START=93 /DNA_END=644 /DNA_ORIENTATION=+
MIPECWQIVLIAVAVTLLQEALNYAFIYRTSAYRGVKESIDRASKRLESLRASTSGNEKQMKKKEKHMDGMMKSAQRDLAIIKFKSAFVVGGLLFAGYKVLTAYYDGTVVAKLPFVPFQFFHAMSHRGLEGTDFTDCSMAFLYAMCASSIRLNLSKLIGDYFGFSAPRSMNQANPFFAPDKLS